MDEPKRVWKKEYIDIYVYFILNICYMLYICYIYVYMF